MSILPGACFSFLLVSHAIGGVSGLTNLEFFDLVKDYVSDVKIVDNDVLNTDDVIVLPGGPNDEIDLFYLLHKLGFSISEEYPEAPYGIQKDKGAEPLLGGCSCSGVTCSCCANQRFVFKLFGKTYEFTLNGCLEVKYLTQNKGFNIKLTVNGRTLYNKEISLSNPPPICFPVPEFPLVKGCLRLYNIDVGNKKACVKLEAVLDLKIKKFTVALDLGCFNIPVEDTEDHIRLRVIELLPKKQYPEAPYGTRGDKGMEPLLGDCSCSGVTCSCCAKHTMEAKLFRVKLRYTLNGCLEVTYLTQSKGLNIKVTVNGNTLYNREISFSNPPPICFPVPPFSSLNGCLRLYNIDVGNKKACAVLDFKIKDFTIPLHLGCFAIPLEGKEDTVRKRVIELLSKKQGLVGKPEVRIDWFPEEDDSVSDDSNAVFIL